MRLAPVAIAGTAVFGAFLLAADPSAAHAQCPTGTLQVGVEERRVGNVIYVHPVCQTVAAPDLRDAPNDGQTVIQLNPVADSAEGTRIAAERRQPCPRGSGTALGQLQNAASGESIGCVMDGAPDAVRADGQPLVAPEPPAPTRVFSPAELDWYNQVPGFREANAELTRARAALQAARRARESLDRRIARAAANSRARSELERRRPAAVQREDTARDASVIANEAREVIIRRAGPPIIRAAPRRPAR